MLNYLGHCLQQTGWMMKIIKRERFIGRTVELHLIMLIHWFGKCSLPPPRTICNSRCTSVCRLATLHKNFGTDFSDLHEIFRKGWKWPVNSWLNFRGDLDHRMDISRRWSRSPPNLSVNHFPYLPIVTNPENNPCIQGLFSGFVTIGRYGKWLTDKLAAQMAVLVRRALADVCTVPVLVADY